MQTYLIMAHGAHCPAMKHNAEVLTLPDNVVVIMNCDDSYMYATREFDAACWAFVTDKDLHLSLRKKRFRVKQFARYLEKISQLTISKKMNNFCIFVDKCPNLVLQNEDEHWRSAIVKAPVTVSLKNHATEVHQEISHELFTKLAHKKTLNSDEKFLAKVWLSPSKEKRHLYSSENISIKPAVIHFQQDTSNITLKAFIDMVSLSDPSTMHVILVTACRSPDNKVQMKLRQYQTKYQPYESAIVFYDKIAKLKQKTS